MSDTAEWIKSQGLYAEANLFVSAKVNGAMLLDMTEWDIGEVIGVKDAMTRDALYRNIVRLRSTSALPSKAPIVVGAVPSDAAVLNQWVAHAQAVIKKEPPPPQDIKLYSSGKSFLEDPAHQSSRGTWWKFKAPIVVGAVPSDAAVLGQKAAQAQAVIKKEPPPPQDIKFYSSGKSFLEDPAHQISRVDLESRYATLDEVKRWLGERVGEPVVTLKGREGFDITDVAMLKSLGQAYFLRKDEFYFLPVEAVGGKLNVYLPSIKREVAVEMLSTTPRLLLVKNFMSKEECDKIIETAKPRLEHSTVAVVEGGKQDSKPDNQVRTSSTAWLNARSTGLKLLDDITERVYELVKVPMDHAEDMQVLHYGYKQHYHAHHDFFDPNMYPTEEYKKGHNRMITVFMYLSDVEEGGETNFPYSTGEKFVRSFDKCEMGLKVKPKLGDCIIFYSMKAEAHRSEGNQLDNNSLHAGCDVLKGDKWSANYWIRNVPWRIGTP